MISELVLPGGGRLRAEAAGVIIDDTTGTRGTSRMLNAGKAKCVVVPSEDFYSKIRAAVDAAKDTGCLVIAASNAKYDAGLDDSIKRVKDCKKLGADIVMCRGIKSIEECRAIAAEVKGPKMYYEYSTTNGKPDVDLDEIGKLGFGIVTVRYLERAALFGLTHFGLRFQEDRNLVYMNYHDFDGLLPEMDHHARLSGQWNDLAREIKDLSVLD